MATTTTPALKLTYFDTGGRAEATRLALIAGGIPFEDDRLKGQAFKDLKPTLPLGSVPTLTIDGTLVVPQSYAILRYALKLAGLTPENPVDELLVDAYVDTMEDIVKGVMPIFFEKDAGKKALLEKKVEEETLPRYLGGLSAMITANKAAPGFAVGSKLSGADIVIFDLLTWLKADGSNFFPSEVLAAYPLLLAICAQVESHPKIAEYLSKRAR